MRRHCQFEVNRFFPEGTASRVKRLLLFFRNSEINKVTENSRWELIQNYHGRVLRPRNPDDWSRGQSVQRLNAGHVPARGIPRHRARDGLEGKRDGRKLRSPFGHRIVHGLEQQPCGVQVVERVGLVAIFRAVFEEEVGGFGLFLFDSHTYSCKRMVTLPSIALSKV